MRIFWWNCHSSQTLRSKASEVQALGNSRPSVRSPPVGLAWTPAPRLDIAPEDHRSPTWRERYGGEGSFWVFVGVWGGYGLETRFQAFRADNSGEFDSSHRSGNTHAKKFSLRFPGRSLRTTNSKIVQNCEKIAFDTCMKNSTDECKGD